MSVVALLAGRFFAVTPAPLPSSAGGATGSTPPNASNQRSPHIGSWHSFLGAGGCLVVSFPTVCSVLDRQHTALSAAALAASSERPCVQGMFAVTEADVTEIRAVVEVRRVFPAIEDNAHARESARVIAGYNGVADRTTQGAAVAPWAAAGVGRGLAFPASATKANRPGHRRRRGYLAHAAGGNR